jgi:hypothetical protein
MVDSMIGVLGWPRIADAGRRAATRDSARGTDREAEWRSGAARRGQTGTVVAESTI